MDHLALAVVGPWLVGALMVCALRRQRKAWRLFLAVAGAVALVDLLWMGDSLLGKKLGPHFRLLTEWLSVLAGCLAGLIAGLVPEGRSGIDGRK